MSSQDGSITIKAENCESENEILHSGKDLTDKPFNNN